MRNYALPVYLLLLLAVTSGRSEVTTETPALSDSENVATTAPENASDTSSQNAVTPNDTSPEPEILVDTDQDSPSSNQTTAAPAVLVIPTDSGPSSNQTTAAPEVLITPENSNPLSNEVPTVTVVTAPSEIGSPPSNETTATPEVQQHQVNSTEAPPTLVPQTTVEVEPTTEAAAATRLGSFTPLLELLVSTLILSLVL